MHIARMRNALFEGIVSVPNSKESESLSLDKSFNKENEEKDRIIDYTESLPYQAVEDIEHFSDRLN